MEPINPVSQSPAKNDLLRPEILRKKLDRSIFARDIVFHQTLDSTNTLAKKLGTSGAPEGTLVLAEEQTAGRGRMGRTWLSPRHANLLFSVLLRPAIEAKGVFLLTMILALATIDGVKELLPLRIMLKWPNDLYVGRKKLGGILTEFSAWKNVVEYVVLGLGLNVNWRPGDEGRLLYPATSILAETGKRVSREDLLARILKRFESQYQKVLDGRSEEFYERWNKESILLNRRVEVTTTGKKICGKALRIDRNGALIILDDRGQERKMVYGDVSVREIGPPIV